MAFTSKSSIIERNAGMMGRPKAPPTGQPAMAPLAGAPLPQNGAALAAGGDNIPATITDQQGKPQSPAAIKAGEIVFSVESIIGAGNGNYDKGAKILLGLHDKLQDHGEAIVQKQSLAGAPTGPGGPTAQAPMAQMPAQAPQGLNAAPGPQMAQALPPQ